MSATLSAGARWLKALHDEVMAMAAQERLRREHLGLWADAESFAELCMLMQRFVLGELTAWPNYAGPRDPETEEIAEALAHANGAGYLTYGSQPGGDGGTWQQRAEVSGWCRDDVRDRLVALTRGTRLATIVRRGNPRYLARSVDYATSVTVSRAHGRDSCDAGATLNRRQIEFMCQGIHERLVEEIIPMNQVTVYDPAWGANRLLWERLVKL